MQKPGYGMEIKLVWFGESKIQFCVFNSGISDACLAGVFSIYGLSDLGLKDEERLSAFRI
jgi:hypothetical protein